MKGKHHIADASAREREVIAEDIFVHAIGGLYADPNATNLDNVGKTLAPFAFRLADEFIAERDRQRAAAEAKPS